MLPLMPEITQRVEVGKWMNQLALPPKDAVSVVRTRLSAVNMHFNVVKTHYSEEREEKEKIP